MEASTESFRACIKKLIADRGLSVPKLTEMLGYASVTTLRRVNQNKAGIKSLRKVYADLISCEKLQLTGDETEMLRAALLREEKGDNYSIAYHEFQKLLHRQKPVLSLPNFIGDSNQIFENLSRLDGSEKIECLILNSCFDAAINLVRSIRNACPQISIIHYFSYPTQPHLILRTIGTLMPLLETPQYTAYTGIEDSNQLPSIHVIVLRSRSSEIEFLFTDSNKCMAVFSTGAYAKYERIAKEYPCNLFTHQLELTEVADLMARYCEIEVGRDSLEIRPDLCLRFYSPDVVRAAFEDRYKEYGLSISKEDENRMLYTQSKRYENIFISNKTTRLILSKKAMLDFLNNGFSCDTKQFLRPYTVSERIQIFSTLLNHVVGNPHFYINFLLDQDEDLFDQNNLIELSCNGDAFMHINPLFTDFSENLYSHSQFAPEITDHNLIRIFRDFFLNDLLPNHTYPQEETVVFLKDCIRRLTEKL